MVFSRNAMHPDTFVKDMLGIFTLFDRRLPPPSSAGFYRGQNHLFFVNFDFFMQSSLRWNFISR